MNSPNENPFSISEEEQAAAEASLQGVTPNERPLAHDEDSDIPDESSRKAAQRLKDLPSETVTMVKLIGWTLAMTVILIAVVICAIISQRAGQSEIRYYEAIKPAVLNPPSHRMLAAIWPGESEAWFFKVVGEVAELDDDKAEEIKAFVQSVKLDPRTKKPTWRKPVDWKLRGPTPMRFATMLIPTANDKTLELSISDGLQSEGFVLNNVNRWRSQLKLEALESVEDQTKTIDIDGVESTWVDMVGRFKAPNMAMPPVAGPGPRPQPQPNPQPNPQPHPPAAGPAKLTYKAPDNWKEEAASSFRKASFQIPNDVAKMEVSIIDLPGKAGGLVANIVRWRGQVKLPSISEDEVLAQAEEIKIDGIDSHYVNLSGPENAILGAIVDRDGFTWFIKLNGPTKPAAAEEARFKEFLKTIKFN